MTKDAEKWLAMSASSLGRAIAAKAVDSVDLANAALERAEAALADHVFISVTRERALAEARASRARISRGRPLSPLDGVPIAWKDLFDIRGQVTTAGSALLRGSAPAARDAAVVANASQAGMVTIGKTNLTEFAYSGLGLNPHFGTPANPFSRDTPRAPGGSSSGSGVAVAANIVPCAIGTDTAGSVRIPSAFNSLVGYKTSHGRHDASGVFPLSQTLDSIGPLARTVEDCILLDTVMRGGIPSDIRRRPVDSLHLYVPETVALDDLQPEVAANFETSLARLGEAGAQVERGPVQEFAESGDLAARLGTITAAEAYLFHRDRIDGEDSKRIDQRVVDRILAGKRMSASDLLTVQQDRVRLVSAIRERLGDRLLVMPSVAITAPEIAPLDADPEYFHKTNLKVLRNTILGSFLDMPGVALPNGFDGDGMPTSFLISGASGRDAEVLAAALAVESVVGPRE